MPPLKYLIFILALSTITIGGYAALVFTVDPYGFYHPSDRGAFSIKPAMPKNQNMAKANIIRTLTPDTVIIGSSRADYAINPAHPAFEGRAAYNGAIRGIRISESKAMIIHAVESGASHILWALDFFTFNQNIKSRPDFKQSRLYNIDGTNAPQSDWKTLISLSSLKPTLQTIGYRNRNDASSTLQNGQTTSMDLDKKNIKKGMQEIFADDVLLYLSRLYFPTPHRSFKFATDKANGFGQFEETLNYLRQKEVNTTLVIPPVHAQLMTLIYQSGLYPYYKMWKTALVLNAQKHGLNIYDFTTLNDVTMESIPTVKDTKMVYWWDISHYKPIVGDAMMSEVLTKKPNTIPQFSGHVMDMASIQSFETELIEYQCNHPDLMQTIRTAIVNAGLENRLIKPLNCP